MVDGELRAGIIRFVIDACTIGVRLGQVVFDPCVQRVGIARILHVRHFDGRTFLACFGLGVLFQLRSLAAVEGFEDTRLGTRTEFQ